MLHDMLIGLALLASVGLLYLIFSLGYSAGWRDAIRIRPNRRVARMRLG